MRYQHVDIGDVGVSVRQADITFQLWGEPTGTLKALGVRGRRRLEGPRRLGGVGRGEALDCAVASPTVVRRAVVRPENRIVGTPDREPREDDHDRSDDEEGRPRVGRRRKNVHGGKAGGSII